MKRIREERPESVEALLLGADKDRAPSPAARARALEAAMLVVGGSGGVDIGGKAGVNSGAGSATTGAVAPKTATVIAWKGWALAALLGTGAIAGGAIVTRDAHEPSPAVSTVARPPAPSSKQEARAAGAAPALEPEPPIRPSPATQVVADARRPPPVAPAANPAPPFASAPSITVAPPATTPTADLSGEVRAVDAARAALVAHDATGALALLDDYDRRYTSGSLAREAALLRTEALMAHGDRAEAVRRAQDLLAQSPDGPYRARLKKVLDEGNAAKTPGAFGDPKPTASSIP